MCKLGSALDDHVPWFDVLDSHDADLALYLSLIQMRRSWWFKWVVDKLEDYDSELLNSRQNLHQTRAPRQVLGP